MKLLCLLVGLSLTAGCALVPVQEQTLHNDHGDTITCKQVGAGVVSGPVGQARFNNCLDSAKIQGYR